MLINEKRGLEKERMLYVINFDEQHGISRNTGYKIVQYFCVYLAIPFYSCHNYFIQRDGN